LAAGSFAPAASGAFFEGESHYLRQSVSCLSSIENTAPSFTSTFLTMQTPPRGASSPPIHGCKQAALTRAEPVDIVRLVEILGERQVQLAQQMPKMIVAVD
jgi:hypothetical protein